MHPPVIFLALWVLYHGTANDISDDKNTFLKNFVMSNSFAYTLVSNEFSIVGEAASRSKDCKVSRRSKLVQYTTKYC